MSSVMTALNDVAVKFMLDTGSSGGDKLDILKMMGNAGTYLKKFGNALMIIAGIVLVIIAVFQIVRGLAGGGRGQVNWVMSIACLLIGGMLLVGGWNMAAGFAAIGKDTVEEMVGQDINFTDFANDDGAGLDTPQLGASGNSAAPTG